ncbi:glycoside hydrolase family 25 protein [Dyadobacter bucti]|uniref:glycoside hydrolase family 25 protein n=1 Tax=Dyadobacter bucti TaxID=2572203 RepID=UPI003F72495A
MNKRTGIPTSFVDKQNVIGVVYKGYRFQGEEVRLPNGNSSLGKWYRDVQGHFYWGGGLLVSPAPQKKKTVIDGVIGNLPRGYILGADLSHHNGDADWAAIEQAGVEFVFLKTTEGVGTRDKKVHEHAKQAMARGMRVGYYHFCRPDTRNGGTVLTDSAAEAKSMLDIIKTLPPPTLPIVLDLEDSTQFDTPLRPDDYLEWIRNFIHITHQSTGMEPIIYSRKEYLDRKLPKLHDLGTTRLWISRYTIKDCNKVEIPRGWTEWSIWQFTDKATIGRNPHLDLNILKDLSLI